MSSRETIGDWGNGEGVDLHDTDDLSDEIMFFEQQLARFNQQLADAAVPEQGDIYAFRLGSEPGRREWLVGME